MDYEGSPNLGPTVGSDPESLDRSLWRDFQKSAKFSSWDARLLGSLSEHFPGLLVSTLRVAVPMVGAERTT